MLFDQALDIPKALSSDAINVSLVGERTRYSLRAKSGDVAAIKKVSGLKLPIKMNMANISKDVVCAKLGPDEWLIVSDPKNKAKLDKAFAKISKNYVCSVVDISHRNVALSVSGPRVAEFINAGCPLDLSLDKFPIGKATRTTFESASIILLRTAEDNFHVVSWRSFAPYLRDFFARIANDKRG